MMKMHWRQTMASALVTVFTILAPANSYAQGWQNTAGYWGYETTEGQKLRGQWLWDQEYWYHFDENGNMQTRWYQDTDGHWYYLNPQAGADGLPEGAMRTGWFTDADKKTYWLNPVSNGFRGAMATGWTETDTGWYDFGTDGVWVPQRESSDRESHDRDRSEDGSIKAPEDSKEPEIPESPENPDGPDEPESPGNDPAQDSQIRITLDTGVSSTAGKTYYRLEDDLISGSIHSNYAITQTSYETRMGKLVISTGSLSSKDHYQISPVQLLPGLNTVSITAVDQAGTVRTETFAIYSDRITGGYPADQSDSDGDGLVNWQEAVYGTDPDDPDTDQDGIGDLEEIEYLGSDALNPDTNGNGILDGDEDPDEDGLTNAQEALFGSHPYLKDSDGDGLTDAEELNLGTNPLNPDTDGDGLSDKQEVEQGTDPLNPDTDGNGIPDGEEVREVLLDTDETWQEIAGPRAEVSLKAAWVDSAAMTMENPEESLWAPVEMPGLIGAAYEFEAGGKIENARLTFSFPEELMEKKDFLPAIYYIDTEDQELTELEDQEIDWANHTVSAETDHFSMYALLDKSEQEKAWSQEILAESQEEHNARIDVMLVLDESGSMSSNDPAWVRVDVSRRFIDTLREGDQAGVVGFDSTARVYHALAEDLDDVKSALDWITEAGGTNIGAGVSAALQQFIPASGYRLTATPANALEQASPSDAATPSDADMEQDVDVATSSDAQADVDATPSDASLWEIDLIYDLLDAPPVSGETKENQEAAMKLIILLTDGDGSYQDSYTQTAIERGVKIYTVGLGQSYNKDLLQRIARQTGGNFYHADDADSLIEEFEKLTSETVDIVTDTDHDGLSDYHESRIRLFNGVTIALNKDNPDCDDDGLLDGEEIIQVTDKKGRVFFKMLSHPNRKDSDGDGILDADDEHPLEFDVRVTEQTDDTIQFNTGRIWERFPSDRGFNAYQYQKAVYDILLNSGVHNDITIEEVDEISHLMERNGENEYTFEELRYIILMDINGACLYLNNKTPQLRKELFESIVERPSKTYRYRGKFADTMFEEVGSDAQDSFWEGKVIQEYDLNLSLRFHYMKPDSHDLVETIDTLIKAAVFFDALFYTSVEVAANLEAVQYYCKNFGIRDGLSMYRTLGTGYVPNGLLSVIRGYEGETDNWERNLKDTSELDQSDFNNLKDKGTVKVNQAGSDRPTSSDPNSFLRTENGEHVFVYDDNGDLIYDISSGRVKGFKINVNPEGKKFFSPYKLDGPVPQFILNLFGW